MRPPSESSSVRAVGLRSGWETLDRVDVIPQAILVVEDDQRVRDSISVALEGEGYRVLQAHRGEFALSILGKHTPDLIISDIVMPGMGGFELLERVRANDEWYPIPFIFLTARAGRSDIRHGMGLGADDYLPKPLDLAELLSAVAARLARAGATRVAIRRDTASHIEVARIAADGGGASAQALVARGDLLRLEGRYAEAMAHSSRALARVSGTAERDGFVRALAHRNAGLCLLRLGEQEAGRQTLEKALRLCEDLRLSVRCGHGAQ